jgi:hypothetical protein
MEEIAMTTTVEQPPAWQDIDADILRRFEEADGLGEAARQSLAMGLPVYYSEPETPAGMLVKEHSDGRRDLVVGRPNPAGVDEMGVAS